MDADISTFNARLSAHERTKIQGVLSAEAESRSFNRINRDIIALIAALEKELATGTENYQIIKAWLKKRYERRLGQKLAGRQPVNLRRLPSTEGTSEETIAAFVPYGSDEIRATIAQTFRDAHGRLLVVGAPGAGKTTLLLQLELDLLQSEPDALPVLLNLATWKKEYATFEAWLKEILPAELGVSKRYAAEIIGQNRLVLLFDGLHEVWENERNSCLDAIGKYGAEAGRRYVISSRKEAGIGRGIVAFPPPLVAGLFCGAVEGDIAKLKFQHCPRPIPGIRFRVFKKFGRWLIGQGFGDFSNPNGGRRFRFGDKIEDDIGMHG